MEQTTQAQFEEILQFWFGDGPATPEAIAVLNRKWFGGGPEFDAAIRQRFGGLPERALRGHFDAWRAAPRSALALVLLLDQFPRNLWRGSPQAFAGDPLAREIALAAIERGFDAELAPVEAVFLYLPLEHAEDLALQERCVALFGRLRQRVPDALRVQFESFESYAARHRDVIRRFGRFPHRNAVLGRSSSEAEQQYLDTGGDTF